MEKLLKLNNKIIKTLHNGKIVIILPDDSSNNVPLFCPCCFLPMKTMEDTMSYRKNKVCMKCEERWTNKPGIIWPDGPDKSSEDWKNYLETRRLLEKPIITFK